MNLVEHYITPAVPAYRNIKITPQKKEEYRDPLRSWPLKGLAYTNELGAVVSGISPKLGTALWVPALMYFGADIYDKYKTDETSYSPSKKRGVKEAVFQTLASVILPTSAVKAGQRAISALSKYSKDGLSVHTKEAVIEKSLTYMQSKSLHTFEDNPSLYAQNFKDSIITMAQDAKGEFKTLSLPKKVLSIINPSKNTSALRFANEEKLGDFAYNQAEKIITMRKELMENTKPQEMSQKLFKKFTQTQNEYKEIYSADKYLGKAAKSILKDFQNSQIFKNKMVKTLGGFIALALLAKPIDNFVEHIVIKKTVEPGLDLLSNTFKTLSGKQNKTEEN